MTPLDVAAIHALLDHAGVDRANRAESVKAQHTYTVGERVQVLVQDRDRAVEAERLGREAHMVTVRNNTELRARLAAPLGGET